MTAMKIKYAGYTVIDDGMTGYAVEGLQGRYESWGDVTAMLDALDFCQVTFTPMAAAARKRRQPTIILEGFPGNGSPITREEFIEAWVASFFDAPDFYLEDIHGVRERAGRKWDRTYAVKSERVRPITREEYIDAWVASLFNMPVSYLEEVDGVRERAGRKWDGVYAVQSGEREDGA